MIAFKFCELPKKSAFPVVRLKSVLRYCSGEQKSNFIIFLKTLFAGWTRLARRKKQLMNMLAVRPSPHSLTWVMNPLEVLCSPAKNASFSLRCWPVREDHSPAGGGRGEGGEGVDEK